MSKITFLPGLKRPRRPCPYSVANNLLLVHALEQASHGGECAAAVEAGLLTRADVTEIGHVLAGDASGRRADDEATAFDSTGLALQDLAVALVALERAEELDLPRIDL